LPSAQRPCHSPRQRLGTRDQPSGVDHQGAANIVIRQAASQMQIKPIQAGDGIRELIPRNDAGIVVYALSPGEQSLDLEARIEPLYNPRLESMIGGTGTPVQITDIAGIVVELRGRIICGLSALRVGNALVSAGIDLREEVASGSHLWQYDIAVVDAERLMNPVRANVTNRC